jgi:hypothetical protein
VLVPVIFGIYCCCCCCAAAAATRLDNIMEHWGCNDDPEASKQRVLLDAVPQFKLFDFGTAVIYPGEQQQATCRRGAFMALLRVDSAGHDA